MVVTPSCLLAEGRPDGGPVGNLLFTRQWLARGVEGA
jgi:hypothetical protein